MFHLSLDPVFDSYLLVAIVAIVLAGLMWFGPSREKAGRRQRVVLALLRAIVIGLIILAMLRPTLVYTQTKKQAATLVVLADQSRSMSVPDAVGNKTRWQSLRDALKRRRPCAGQASARLRVEGLHVRRRRERGRRRGGQDPTPRQARGTANGHRRGPERRVGPRGGQAALGCCALERRRRSGPTPRAICRRKRPPPDSKTAAIRCSRFPSASRADWARPKTWPSRTSWSTQTCS